MNSASRYEVVLESAAVNDLKRLPPDQRDRVVARIVALQDDARPRGARKIVGSRADWRIRVGDQRIIYTIDDRTRTIAVMRVRPRARAYD